MQILDGKEKDYKEWRDKNTDPYGNAVFTYAERWAESMEQMIEEVGDVTKAIAENAESLSHEADTEGITGFMYGAAVSILAQCWKHGETLRAWHNGEYNYEGEGVVNPAILVVKG